MPKYIIYKTHNENTRKITVINGQPYYQSTGHNSGLAGVWLPFLMVVGNKQIQLEDSLKKKYNCEELNKFFPILDLGHLLKFIEEFLNRTDKLSSIAKGRFPTKETLITSLRLGSSISNAQTVLTTQEWQLSNTPITFDEQESEVVITDPDAINDWLIQQDATFVKTALTNNLRIPPILVSEQRRLEETNNENYLNYLLQLKVRPDQYINSYNLISTEIKRIQVTIYDTSALKFKKIVALLELQQSILTEIRKANLFKESIKPLGDIIFEWKSSKSVSDPTVNNYALIAEHRRTGFFAFFNIGRTISHAFIDNLLDNSTLENSSNCIIF